MKYLKVLFKKNLSSWLTVKTNQIQMLAKTMIKQFSCVGYQFQTNQLHVVAVKKKDTKSVSWLGVKFSHKIEASWH